MNNQGNFTSLIVLVAVGLIFGSLLRLQPVSSSNDRSRWSTVWSLNAGQGYVIDETPYPTIDKVKRGDHFYSSKPALMPTLIAGLVWAIGPVTGMTLPENQDFIVRFVLVLVNLIPFAWLLVLYSRLLQRLGFDTSTVLYCLCAAGLGTYLTAYSVTLNNHTMAAIAVFFALYCFIRIVYEGQREWKYFAVCGLFSAWAVANEMLALPLALVVMGWLFRTSPKATATWFLPPAVLLGAAFMITLYLSTGGLLPYYLYFDTPLYQYEGSYWNQPKGIDAADDPKWFYLFNLILGHHGLLSLTPVFILSFAGFFVKDRLQGIHRLGAVLTAAMVVFYTLHTNNYGGNCQGARWLFWLIPFWLLTLPAVVRQVLPIRRYRWIAYLLLIVSLASIGFAMSGHKEIGRPGPWSSSWLHLAMRSAGWIDY